MRWEMARQVLAWRPNRYLHECPVWVGYRVECVHLPLMERNRLTRRLLYLLLSSVYGPIAICSGGRESFPRNTLPLGETLDVKTGGLVTPRLNSISIGNVVLVTCHYCIKGAGN